MKNLVISSPFYDPGTRSTLVTEENWKDIVNAHGAFHTSLGDITSTSLLYFCDTVDEIEFKNFEFESIPDTRDKTYIILNSLSHKFDIKGYSQQLPDTYLTHDMTRPDADRVIWVFGCSFSHGYKLNPDQTYSYHLYTQLKFPTILVTQPGSSLKWSLRHLMHANLRPSDLVVWQITTFFRDSVKDHAEANPVEIIYDNKNLYKAKLLSFEQMIFNHLSLLDHGVQYLRAKNQKFYLISFDPKEFPEYRNRLLMEYTKYPEYCYAPDYTVDCAQDNKHPGPRSHEIMSDFLLRKIQHG
jgi:hypothetical protein